MRQEFKIDARHQIRSFRECFVTLGWTMLAMVGPFFIDRLDYSSMFVICILFWLVISVGTCIPFHLQYLFRNWTTILTVDNELKEIEIQEKGITYKYKFSDIKTERHLLGHYRPDREKSWTPIPFDYYGYVKIKTVDNKDFVITSLMADPFDFPLTIDKTKYGFTIITKDVSYGEIKSRERQYRENKIQDFIDSFETLPDEKLIYKLDNRDKYDKEAIVAVERILERRKKISAANRVARPTSRC